MLITKTIAEARGAVARLRAERRCIGLVPTMGALHAGHLSLVRAAKAHCDAVVATIFVNPTQFSPEEDFAMYPRTFEADCAALEAEGVDVLFAPEAGEMYPAGASTVIEVPGISDRLDAVSRPGHFRGVATVVRRMVRDLNFVLELVVCPTVREADGLALSSRNRYLSEEERGQALVLSRALRRVSDEIQAGVVDSQRLTDVALGVLADEPEVRLDYFRIVDPETLEDVEDVSAGALVAVAAMVGPTRLIDNVVIPPR